MLSIKILGPGCANCRKLEEIVRQGKPESAQEVSLFRLGWALSAGQRWKEAAETFDRLLAQHPKTRFAADALWQLGSAREQLKQPEAAIAAWAQLADPTRPATSSRMPRS